MRQIRLDTGSGSVAKTRTDSVEDPPGSDRGPLAVCHRGGRASPPLSTHHVMNTPAKHRSAPCALSFRTWAGNHPLVLAWALVGAILPATPPASAQSHTWTGGNPDNTFWSQGYVDHAPLGVVGPEDEPSNWNVNDAPNGAPNTPGGPEDTVLIAGSPPTSMNVSAAVGCGHGAGAGSARHPRRPHAEPPRRRSHKQQHHHHQLGGVRSERWNRVRWRAHSAIFL